MPATSSVAIQPVNWFTGSHPPQFINQDDRRPMIPLMAPAIPIKTVTQRAHGPPLDLGASARNAIERTPLAYGLPRPQEKMMRLKMFAVAAVLVAAGSSGALAQICPPGYGWYGGVCSPYYPPGYSNPVSGAFTGEAYGASTGYSAAGPVGAVVGGALGIAAGTLSGTVGMFTPASCPYPYRYYNGACYR